MKCPKCGTAVQGGAAFCMACGAPLEARTEMKEDVGLLAGYCTRCGAELRTENAFCGRCGAPVMAPIVTTRRQRTLRYGLAAATVLILLLAALGGIAGYRAWVDARELEAHYAWGVAALEAGDYRVALTELGWVAKQAPGYQDVDTHLNAARTAAGLDALHAQAEADCAQQRWEEAIGTLENLRLQAPEYEVESVAELLFTAYSEAGLQLAARSEFADAITHFEHALALNTDEVVERQKQMAILYLEGLSSLEQHDWSAARDALQAVHDLDPIYHDVAAQLYEACSKSCEELTAEGRLDAAEAECRAALQLQPAGQEANDALAQIAYLRTPSPTPTLPPTPTRTPSPTPQSSPTPTATETPAATPRPKSTPKPSCRHAAKGLIGFKRQKRCDARTGNGCGAVVIWVMNGDGSNQAPMCDPQDYYWGLERDRRSPDGTWRVEVRGRGADIARIYQGGREEMIIVNNRTDWDPVLSLDGWWLAWVTNRNANDEIYIKTLDPQDQNQRRLTVNAWEWDKHPSWSPDGRRLAFYSNRADKLNEATRQIWVMDVVNDLGANLRNLSQRPDQVDTDPVWFKWEEMP